MLCWIASPLLGLCPLLNISKFFFENSRENFHPTKNSLQNLTYFQNVISNPVHCFEMNVFRLFAKCNNRLSVIGLLCYIIHRCCVIQTSFLSSLLRAIVSSQATIFVLCVVVECPCPIATVGAQSGCISSTYRLVGCPFKNEE